MYIVASIFLGYNRNSKGGDLLAISKAQQRATAKYVSKAYDRIEAKVPKGQKVIIQAHAEDRGESVNGFINRAINETVKRDSEGGRR